MKCVSHIAFIALMLALAFSLAGTPGLRGQDAATASSSVVPPVIKFSGVIPSPATPNRTSDSAAAGLITATFSFYALQEGGSPLWSESQKVQLDEQGRYVVFLGATAPDGLPLELFTSGKALWLGVQPQMSGVGELPRVLLAAVPYALKAADSETLGGKPASAYALAGAPATVEVAGIAAPSSASTTTTSTGSQANAAAGSTSSPQAQTACTAVTSDGKATANTLAKFTSACNIEKSLIRDTGTEVAVGGTAAPGALLDVQFTSTATSGLLQGHRVLTTLNPAATSSATTNGIFSYVMTASGNTQNFTADLSAMKLSVSHFGKGTLPFGGGLVSQVVNRAAGTMINATAIYAEVMNDATGTIKNGYGLYVNPPTNSGGGTFSHYAGLYIGNPSAVTGAYGVYSAGGTNYFAGNVGIGTPTPGANLEVNGTAKFDGLISFASGQTFPGTGTITGITTAPGSGLTGGGTSGNLTLTVNESVVAFQSDLTTGINTAESFATNAANTAQTNAINTAESFATNAANTAQTNAISTAESFATNAANTAQANAINTADLYAASAASTAQTNAVNTAEGYANSSFLPLTGGTLSGALSGTTATFGGAVTAAGTELPSTGTATAAQGFTSNPMDLLASSFNSGTSAAVPQLFRWEAEPAGNNTASPSGTLNLLYLAGAGTPAETGLSIAGNGQISFASGQTFPGTGTITGITTASGSGLTGGGTSGNLSLTVDESVVAFQSDLSNGINTAESFAGNAANTAQTNAISTAESFATNAANTAQTNAISTAESFATSAANTAQANAVNIAEGYANSTFLPLTGGTLTGALNGTSATFTSGDVSLGSGNLDLPQTASATAGVINLGGSAFLHACCFPQVNTFVGANAGNFTTTGSNNTGAGNGTLLANTTGYNNTASGTGVLTSNTAGYHNTGTGWSALWSNTTGNFNTASGSQALYANTDGAYNTAIGTAALTSNCAGDTSGCTASYNTALGFSAGVTATSANANTTGWNNTFIGANSGPGTSTQLMNATALGYNALVSASNSLVLGGTGANAVNVGIGTATPAYTLDVQGTGNFTGPVTFAAGQTFPGVGTITGVTAGTGLTGGGASGNVSVSIPSAGVTDTMLANPYSGTGSCTGSYVTALSRNAGPTCMPLPVATTATAGIVELAGDVGGSAGSVKVTGLQGVPISSTVPTSSQVLTYNGSIWAPANASSGGASIYGDGSDGSVSVGSANWTTSAPSYTLQFQDFTVTGALTVPSGLIIRATGNVLISGSITVAPSPANTGTSSVQGISEQGASSGSPGSAGLAYSAFQLRQLLKPGLNGGGSGAAGGSGTSSGGGGGTLVILAAGSITVQSGGSITANGTAGSLNSSSGIGGGGGAGGVIILASKTSISNGGTITTNGGAGAPGQSGSCSATGTSASGGGGGGVLHLLAPSVTAGTATANGGPVGSSDNECGYGGYGGASGGNGGSSGTTISFATAGSAGVSVTTAVEDPATLFLP